MSRAAADLFAPNGCLDPEYFTADAYLALQAALKQTRQTHWDTLRSPHVFMGLLEAPDDCIRAWARHWHADTEQLLADFRSLFHLAEGSTDAPLVLHREFFSDNVLRVLRLARQRALGRDRQRVTPTDLLISVLTSANSIVAECFERIGVTAAKLTEMAVIAEQKPQ